MTVNNINQVITMSSSSSCGVDDDDVFANLMTREISFRQASTQSSKRLCGKQQRRHRQQQTELWFGASGQVRHLLLSWMVDTCDANNCQDEVFPHAARMLDAFLEAYPRRLAMAAAKSAGSSSSLTEISSTRNNINDDNNNNNNNNDDDNTTVVSDENKERDARIARLELGLGSLFDSSAHQNYHHQEQVIRKDPEDDELLLELVDSADREQVFCEDSCAAGKDLEESSCSSCECVSSRGGSKFPGLAETPTDDESGVEADYSPMKSSSSSFCPSQCSSSLDSSSMSLFACELNANDRCTSQCNQRQQQQQQQLGTRQLHLFGACCLLLASKLRQTPSLEIRSLILASCDWHFCMRQLTREEIISAELLVLTCLKWDLALVVPNDFVSLLSAKCLPLISLPQHVVGVDGMDNNNGNSVVVDCCAHSNQIKQVSVPQDIIESEQQDICGIAADERVCRLQFEEEEESSSCKVEQKTTNCKLKQLASAAEVSATSLAVVRTPTSPLMALQLHSCSEQLSPEQQQPHFKHYQQQQQQQLGSGKRAASSASSAKRRKAADNNNSVPQVASGIAAITTTATTTEANVSTTITTTTAMETTAATTTTTTTETSQTTNKQKLGANEAAIRRQTRRLIELAFLMDSSLSRIAPSLLAMSAMAVAISGLKSQQLETNNCWQRLTLIVSKIHEATNKVNKLEHMIDVAIKIETLLRANLNSGNTSNHDDDQGDHDDEDTNSDAIVATNWPSSSQSCSSSVSSSSNSTIGSQ